MNRNGGASREQHQRVRNDRIPRAASKLTRTADSTAAKSGRNGRTRERNKATLIAKAIAHPARSACPTSPFANDREPAGPGTPCRARVASQYGARPWQTLRCSWDGLCVLSPAAPRGEAACWRPEQNGRQALMRRGRPDRGNGWASRSGAAMDPTRRPRSRLADSCGLNLDDVPTHRHSLGDAALCRVGRLDTDGLQSAAQNLRQEIWTMLEGGNARSSRNLCDARNRHQTCMFGDKREESGIEARGGLTPEPMPR